MTDNRDPGNIRRAVARDADAVGELLAEAFLHGDLASWLVPQLNTRARIYPRYFALMAEHAFTHGQVEMTEGGSAVAVWYSIDGHPLPELPHYDRRLAEITARFHPRFAALDLAMHNHHPYDRPHHYLAFLAVHPDQQSRGLGGALLDHHHAGLDATGESAYLEATGSRNLGLYARYGYRPRPAYRITRDGLLLYPAWRPSATVP